MSVSVPETPETVRKTRFVFTPARDIKLLNAVLQNETWLNENWFTIYESMKDHGYSVTRVSVKERCTHLRGLYKKQNLDSIKRSGTEEQYNERANLLKEVCKFFDSEVIIKTAGPEDEEASVDDEGDDGVIEETAEPNPQKTNITDMSMIPSKKVRLQEKKKSDKLRDYSRDTLPELPRTKKTTQQDVIDQKIKFDMDMKKKEFDFRELEEQRKFELRSKELDLESKKETQQYEIKKTELEIEAKRLEVASQANSTNATMLELMKQFLSQQKK